jgi:hypothetical protein
VAPNEWVFNDPVFLLLNVAVGGNFGGATGTLEVSVAAGAFTDGAGNANTEGASASQAYSTPADPGDRFVITFDEAAAPVLTGFGGAGGSVVADPTDAANKVAEVVKSEGDPRARGAGGLPLRGGRLLPSPVRPLRRSVWQ